MSVVILAKFWSVPAWSGLSSGQEKELDRLDPTRLHCSQIRELVRDVRPRRQGAIREIGLELDMCEASSPIALATMEGPKVRFANDVWVDAAMRLKVGYATVVSEINTPSRPGATGVLQGYVEAPLAATSAKEFVTKSHDRLQSLTICFVS